MQGNQGKISVYEVAGRIELIKGEIVMLVRRKASRKTYEPTAAIIGSCRPRRQIWSGLGDRRDGSHRSSTHVLNSAQANILAGFAVGSLLRAVTGDVTGLTALVASLSSRVQGTAVGSGAVAGDVAELAASVALHGLSLAITGEMVGPTALVARSRARTTDEANTSAGKAAISATAWADWAATAHVNASRVRASAL